MTETSNPEPTPEQPAAVPPSATDPEPVPQPPPVAPGPIAALTEGMTAAAANARQLRTASIYLGLLTLALAGPAVAVQMWFETLSIDLDPTSFEDQQALGEMLLRSGVLIVVAALGVLAVTIEGAAIGIVLMAGRIAGQPVSLRAAVERSRRVFWRLVRVGVLVGILEVVASLAWRAVTGQPSIDGVPDPSVDPIVGTLVALPFLYANVAVVLADDKARASMRRSFRLVRRHRRLAVALGLFALLSGVVEGLALGSGLDLIIRAFDVLQLDVSGGGASLLVAFVLASALVAAAGSLLFTVGAVVSAPQVVAWIHLREPLIGMPADLPEALPVERADALPWEQPPPVPVGEAAPVGQAAPVGAAEPAGAAEPEPVTAPEPAAELVLAPQPAAEPVPAPPPPAPDYSTSAWNRPTPFRWVTVQMRFVIVVIWVIAVVAFASGPPA